MLLAFIRRDRKIVAKLYQKSLAACPDHKELTLKMNRAFLAGMSIGHWEGKLALLKEFDEIVSRQL